MKNLLIVFGLLSLCFSCKTPSSTSNNSGTESNKGDSSRYANIFRPWDGHWKGEFLVLNQGKGQLDAPSKPELNSVEQLREMQLDTGLVIHVEQFYESTSPYYQTVNITDSFLQDGKMVEVKSQGYNVVRGDSILCVVHKPDETVVHNGEDLGKGIILWSREIASPLKAEYFFETATDSSYTIVGWGYYGSDRLEKSPKDLLFWRIQEADELIVVIRSLVIPHCHK